jgi:type I restriction enzyme S subunit
VKSVLGALSCGHNGGIYTPPIHNFSRNYVTSEEHGVPFIGSTAMLWSDLSRVKRLAKKDAYSKKLSPLRLSHGMTLISCSGTIGRTAYTRPLMEGIWSSGDVMKVAPDPTKVRPGYLYAVLSSEIGVPRIISGTYGTIVKHIEAPHLAELTIPRLDDAAEAQIAQLVEQAAQSVDEYGQLLGEATSLFLESAGLEDSTGGVWHDDSVRLGWGEQEKTYSRHPC